MRGARAEDYKIAIMWLSDCGLVHKVGRADSGKIPLQGYEDLKSKTLKMFKDKFNIEKSIRTVMTDYREGDWIINMPLYAISEIRAK